MFCVIYVYMCGKYTNCNVVCAQFSFILFKCFVLKKTLNETKENKTNTFEYATIQVSWYTKTDSRNRKQISIAFEVRTTTMAAAAAAIATSTTTAVITTTLWQRDGGKGLCLLLAVGISMIILMWLLSVIYYSVIFVICACHSCWRV